MTSPYRKAAPKPPPEPLSPAERAERTRQLRLAQCAEAEARIRREEERAKEAKRQHREGLIARLWALFERHPDDEVLDLDADFYLDLRQTLLNEIDPVVDLETLQRYDMTIYGRAVRMKRP